MDHPALDPLMGEMIGDCQAACRAADLAAETAGDADASLCVTHLREVARLITRVESFLLHHFLEPAPAVPVFADPTSALATPPEGEAAPVPAKPVVPPPPPLPPADPFLRTLTTPAVVGMLAHEIRGIRSIFVLGADLDLKPADREPLFVAAAQMTRRLEPLIRNFFAHLGGSAETGELRAES